MERTKARTLLFQHGIRIQEIAEQCGIPRLRVQFVLHPERFGGVRYETVKRVRAVVERALTEAGHKPSTGQSLSSELWTEYDEQVALNQENAA